MHLSRNAAPFTRRALPASWGPPLRRIARLGFGLVALAWSLLLIAWLSLHWIILPHIQEWRAPIESRASAALGVGVRIGSIEVRSGGWVPGVELRDVILLDASGRVALRLPRVVAALSPRSLVALDLRLDQLLIDGAELEARRDAQGRIFVAGLDFGGSGGASDDSTANWFFKQGEFVIRGGSLRWTDEQRQVEPLALTDVQLVVRNGVRDHDVRLDATPPPAWGDRFVLQGRFRQPLLAASGDWRRWSGTAYADLPRADVRELKRHITLPFDLREGNGAIRAWIDVREGEPRVATVDVALRMVALRLAPEVDALTLEEVVGRLEGRRDREGYAVALKGFSFATDEGLRWPRGDVGVRLRQREGEEPSGGEFTAQRLDLGVISEVAARIPLGAAVRRLLAELHPRGVANDIGARWDGPLDAPAKYQVQGQLTGLSLASRESAEPHDVGRPGLRNASLQLRATEAGGDARIAVTGGALELPGVFADPLVPLERLAAQLVWTVGAASPRGAPLTVQLKEATFANADAKGQLTATWTSGDVADVARGGRFPGRLELDGKVMDGVAVRVGRYLPLGLPDQTRHYVEAAVRGGTIKTMSVRVKGHLRDFPFHNARSGKDGEFRIAAQAQDATLAFIPDASEWPPLTQLSGELLIDRSTLEFRNARAHLGAVEWNRVQGSIPNLGERPVLTLGGEARAGLDEMLKVVNATPVGGWTGQALATSTATGNADLKLGLVIPLTTPERTTAKGSLVLAGNDVRITAETPLLGTARGRVDFSEKGFSVVGGSARVLGGDAGFEGGTQADGSIRFTGQGVASAEGLRRARELGALAQAAASFSGQASYRVNIGFVQGRSQLLVTSNLAGLGIDLPAPLNKAPATPLELRYQVGPADPESAAPTSTPTASRDRLRLELGNLIQASYWREHDGASTRIVRGGIGVSSPMPAPASGVAASLNLQSLDVGAWEGAYDRLFSAAAAAPATTPAEPAPRGAERGAADSVSYVPTAVALRAQTLVSGSHRLTSAVIGASEEADGLWRASVNADQLDGYIEYRPTRRRAGGSLGPGAGRIYARLSRLSLPKSDAEQVETLLDEPPASVPGLDIIIDDFELRGRRLGRVEVEAANRIQREPGREPVREWRLAKLNVTLPEAQLTATGTWAAATPGTAAGRRRAAMDFKLHLDDSGALLDRMGIGKAIRGGKGDLAGKVSWAGSPLALDYPSLSGEINVAIDAGQFLKAEPGAARLLSVLSLQSLPRRLSFDFRDLFERGFAFDNVTGDITINEGVARSNNLRMRGPQAVVLMEGSADISRETQDLRVVVVPEINAGTASLAYAIINPALGIGTFLAQYFLRKPLIEAGTREFHVSGPWDDPKVERVERKRTTEPAAANVSAGEAPAEPRSRQ